MIGTDLYEADFREGWQELGASLEEVNSVLAVIQGFDPPDIGARDLKECLAIQLRERDRFDPAMAALVANLELVARHDWAGLRRVCGVDDEDLADMVAELKRLVPKPGLAFGSTLVQPVVPDVTVRPAPDGATEMFRSRHLPVTPKDDTMAERTNDDERSTPVDGR